MELSQFAFFFLKTSQALNSKSAKNETNEQA